MHPRAAGRQAMAVGAWPVGRCFSDPGFFVDSKRGACVPTLCTKIDDFKRNDPIRA